MIINWYDNQGKRHAVKIREENGKIRISDLLDIVQLDIPILRRAEGRELAHIIVARGRLPAIHTLGGPRTVWITKCGCLLRWTSHSTTRAMCYFNCQRCGTPNDLFDVFELEEAQKKRQRAECDARRKRKEDARAAAHEAAHEQAVRETDALLATLDDLIREPKDLKVCVAPNSEEPTSLFLWFRDKRYKIRPDPEGNEEWVKK